MIGHRSIARRLTLLFALASAAVLMAFGLSLKYAVERHFEQQDSQELSGKLELVRHALSQVASQADLDALPRHLDDALVGHHGLSVSVVTDDGAVLFASAGSHSAQTPGLMPIAPPGSDKVAPLTWQSDGHSHRGIAARVPTAIRGMPPVSVVLSLDIEHHMEFMAMFERAMWASVAIGILLTGLLGWFAAHRGLAPLRGIVELARGISASHLNQRLPLAAVPVELIDLVTEFNGMLARLEDSFKRLSDFSSDLAHELRTPVSNLMTQTQVALTQARSAEAYREVLYSSMEEYDRLARMIADMLFLAKADHGLIVPRREIVDLAVEIEELFEFYDALAEAQGVRLSTTGQAMVTGDKLMLRRALSNLISNAIRHTPRLGTVHVEIAMQASGGVHIGIANPGTPVSPEHLPHLFERFYRVDPSRQRSSEGAGLGLAITKSIILAHGGSITVHSDKESTRFDIRLPQAGGAIDAAAASLPH